jgi:hypothetical protein
MSYTTYDDVPFIVCLLRTAYCASLYQFKKDVLSTVVEGQVVQIEKTGHGVISYGVGEDYF